MKTQIKRLFITLSMIIFVVNVHAQNQVATELLNNPQKQDEIFNAILDNHDLMMKFMAKMKENKHAMSMMKSHSSMDETNHGEMKMMMDNMMNMAENDSSMCRNMMKMIMEKPNMMKMMMEKMHEKDMMDKNTMMKNKEIMQKEK